MENYNQFQFSRSVVSDSLRTAASQASLSITNSSSLPKLMSIEPVMPSKHLILCHPLLLLPSIFPNFRVFSNESALHIGWPKYWNFSFSFFSVTGWGIDLNYCDIECLPWKRTEIILSFLKLHPSTAFRTLLLTMMATHFF